MEEDTKKVLLSLRKEKILISKMVYADEIDSFLLFNSLKDKFKETSNNTNNLINTLFKNYSYDELFSYISERIENTEIGDEKLSELFTLISLINSKYLNNDSNNFDNDYIPSKFLVYNYGLYLWFLKENNCDDKFKNAIREDLVIKLTNSNVMRKYFAGDFKEIEDYFYIKNCNSIDERHFVNTSLVSLLGGEIKLSNKFEMFEGILDDTSYNSRKEMLKLEYAAICLMMMEQGIIVPVEPVECSDFSKNIIKESSELVEKYKNKENNGKKKIISL